MFAPRIRGLRRRRVGGVGPVPQRAALRPVRLSHSGRHQRGAGGGRVLQPACRRARDAVRFAAHPWGTGVRDGEHDHGAHQARGPRPVHRHRVHGLLCRQPRAVRTLWDRGHRCGRRVDFLLLHRVGRRLDGRRGGSQPPPEPSPRDRLRDHHRDHVLHSRGACRGRCTTLPAVRRPGGRPVGDHAQHHRIQLASRLAGRWRDHLDLQRYAGRAVRAVAHLVRHGARRDAPRDLPPGGPAHPRPGAQHHHRLHLRRAARWVRAARRAHRPDEHGNPRRLHRGVHRRDHPPLYPAGLAPRVQGPWLPGNAHTQRCLRPLPDLRSAVHYVRAVRGVARGRGDHLLHVQRQALAAGEGDRGRHGGGAAMKYLVALTALSGRDALSLGRMLARTGDVTLTVCIVLPEAWGHPSPARVDAEYAAFLKQYAEDTIAEAREFLGDTVRAEYTSTSSASEGLIATATETGAALIALGSARHGPLGRFTVGGIANEMLHVSLVPVALAPRGYRPSSDTQLHRVTCAFSGSTQSRSAFDAAVQLSSRHGVPLRLTTFVVRGRQMYPSQVGYDAERLVAEQWRAQALEAQEKALATLPDVAVEAGIIEGRDWEEALDSLPWEEGEVLVVGSSRLGPVARVFLGSNSTKIVRSSPVPVLVIPRGAD